MSPAYTPAPYTTTVIAGLGGAGKEKDPVPSAGPETTYPERESITIMFSPGTGAPVTPSMRCPAIVDTIGQRVTLIATVWDDQKNTYANPTVYPEALARRM